MNQITQINNGAKLFILVGMLIEAQAKVPGNILQDRLATILEKMKSTDPQKFAGLKEFLKARGIKLI